MVLGAKNIIVIVVIVVVVTVVGGSSGMEYIGTSSSGRHDESDLVEMLPPFIAKWFRLGMLPNIISPRRSGVHSNAGACGIVPDPARDFWMALMT